MNVMLYFPYNPEYEWAFKEGVQHEIEYKQGILLKRYGIY